MRSIRASEVSASQDGFGAGVEFLGELGRGAGTIVSRARRQGVDYALKMPMVPVSYEEQGSVAFRREAAMLACVTHPGLPRIFEVGYARDRPFIIMDLVDGESLEDVLVRGPVQEAQVAAIAVDAAGALAAAHRAGLVHRDVKPKNIMIVPSGPAKLIDFGLAKWAASEGKDSVSGTFSYMAPEQTGMLKRVVDGRSDLYSLGVTLFQCLTGRLPFVSSDAGELMRMHTASPAPQVRELRPDVSPVMEAIVAKLLAKDPDDRYQSGESLAADLERLGADGGDAVFVLGSSDAGVGAALAPMVGRGAELDELLVRWDKARSGEGGMALVSCAAGGGKSRLVQEFLTACGRDTPVLQGKSSQDEAVVPLAPLRAAVEQHLSAVKRLPEPARSAALDRVRAAAQPVALMMPTLSPSLADLIEARQVPGEDMQEQFTNAVATFLAGFARQAGGAILYLDDVQWLDAGTRRVLRRLADELARTPMLLIATARDDGENRAAVEAFAAGLDRVIDTHISLAPLDDDAAGELIAEHLGGVAVAPALAARLASRCAGNPLMVGEYVRAIVDAGLLRPSWGFWVLEEQGLDALALPEDVLALIGSRVQGLGLDSRRVLAAAAAIGMRFRPDRLAAVCRLDERSVQEAIRVAIDRRLVGAAEGGRYEFAHDRIREALLADADEPSLRALHQRIAEVLEASPAVGSEQVYAVARHYLGGQTDRTPQRALAACLAAGQLALAEYAPQEALEYLLAGNAVAAAGIEPDSRFHAALGLAYLRAGRFDEAKAPLSQALTVESDASRRAMMYELIAEIHASCVEYADAIAACRRGLAELGRRLPTNPVLLVFSSIVLFARGLLMAWLRPGFGTATGEQRQKYQLECSLNSVAQHSSAIRQSVSDQLLLACLLLRQLGRASRLGISLEYVHAYTDLAAALCIVGLRRRSARLFRRMRDIAAQVGDPRAPAYVDWIEGVIRTVYRRDEVKSLRILPRSLIEHGRWLDAKQHLDAGFVLCTSLTFSGHPAESQHWRERVLTPLSDYQQARGHGCVVSGAANLAVLGQSEDAAAELSRNSDMLKADQPGHWGSASNYLMIALMAAVERGRVGEEFETRVAQMRRLRLTPRRALPVWWPMWTSVARGRVEQFLAASEQERPARLAAARHAIREIPRGRRSPYILAHRLILEATLRQATGDNDGAFRRLERAERTARRLDAPILEYDIARVRARTMRSVDCDAEAHRQASFALQLAEEYGWQHRVRWIRSEFAVHTSEYRTPTSASSQLNLRRLDALQQVSLAAATVLDQRELARVALDETLRIVGAERAFLFLIDEESSALVPQLGRDAAGTELTSLTAYATSLVERVRASGQPLVVTGDEKGNVPTSESAVTHGLLSIMVAPVRLKGTLRGVVYLDSRAAKGVFTDDDVDILMAIVNQVAISLETAHAAVLEAAVQATRQQRDLAETLRSAMSRMSQTLVPDEVLGLLLDTSARTAPAQAACLLRRQGKSLVVNSVTGQADPAAVGKTIHPADDRTLAALLDAAAPTRATVAAGHPAPLSQVLTGIRSWIALPLLNRTELVGIVLAGSSRPDAYTEADVEVQAALAGQGMVAYENARLFYLARRQATRDGLTGIYNRRHLLEQATHRFATAQTHHQPLGALMIDVDHFKRVNDQYGHAIGDEVLRAVATQLRSHTRGGDLVGRYGGEEFAVFVTSGADAAWSAERLRAAVAATSITTPAGTIHTTVSIGVACQRPDDTDLDAVLVRADAALYRAKHQGRNRVVTGRRQA